MNVLNITTEYWTQHVPHAIQDYIATIQNEVGDNLQFFNLLIKIV